jgi:predicted Rossmann fold flavoprotein
MGRKERVWPAIIVGGGAAGLMAAIFAARGGLSVLVVETRRRPGAKILMSGGGRCNVLPSKVELDEFYTSGSTRSLRNLLQAWPLDEVRYFFEHDLGVRLKTEPSGKVFPRSDDAREVLGALLNECTRCGVRLQAPFRVNETHRREGSAGSVFGLSGAGRERLHGRRLVLATGGLSLPSTGSDGAGLEMARRFGHHPVPTYPALVPLLSAETRWQALAGVSVRVRLNAERRGRLLGSCEGDLLFTHRGFSGPAVLDLSRHLTHPGGGDVRLLVQWGGGSVLDWDGILQRRGRGRVGGTLCERLPERLAACLLALSGVEPERKLAELPRAARRRLAEVLGNFPLPVAGNEGYRTAEVTGGGIPLSEVAAKTLESRLVPGLYFCGEILDVIGRLGGYNFLWAWVTGRRAGEALAAATYP